MTYGSGARGGALAAVEHASQSVGIVHVTSGAGVHPSHPLVGFQRPFTARVLPPGGGGGVAEGGGSFCSGRGRGGQGPTERGAVPDGARGRGTAPGLDRDGLRGRQAGGDAARPGEQLHPHPGVGSAVTGAPLPGRVVARAILWHTA